MDSTIVSSHPVLSDADSEDIRRELERVVASPVFRGSKRCQSFLQHVVSKTLDGETKTLKERALAIEIFGRSSSEDLTDDSIVRVSAREVRKRLAQYYVAEGAHDLVRIELPAGSYIPVFQFQPPVLATDVTAPTELKSQAPLRTLAMQREKSGWRRYRWILLGCAVVCLAGGIFLLQPKSPGDSAVETFWQPAFHDKLPCLLLLAHPIVYQPSTRASQADARLNGDNTTLQRAIQIPSDQLTGSDFVPAFNHFVGVGDALAAIRFSSIFSQHHRPASVRLASREDFYDLRSVNAVLIGAFTNRWTMELTKNMKYRFSYNQNWKPCISDTSTCRWTLGTKSDNDRSSEDYVLVTRLPHPATNGFVVIAAGLNSYGTEESGRILTDPEVLAPILKQLPAHWADHNLELVLHVSVIGDAPAQSNLVAVHSW